MSKQQAFFEKLSVYLHPGEQLLDTGYAEETSHDLARIVLAGLAPTSASKFVVGLTHNRLMLLLDNLATKVVKPKDTDNIFIHDIAHIEITPKRGSTKASFILRNGKKRSFLFYNYSGGDRNEQQNLLGKLQGMLQEGTQAQQPAPPLPRQPNTLGGAGQSAPEPPAYHRAQASALPQPCPGNPPRACPACGQQCAPDDKFCEMCGAPLQKAKPRFCPQCGRETRPGAKFCGGCGFALQR